MQVCAGDDWRLDIGHLILGVLLQIPIAGIEGFGDTEIEGELRDDLPAETEVGAASETVCGGDRIGIEDIVLVRIDAILPILAIEELGP